MTYRILVQEQWLTGTTALERYREATELGFDGLELRSRGDGHFATRLPELLEAARAGAVMPTACVEMSHFVGAFDPELRRDAVTQLKSQLTVMAAIGGTGIMTPAAYGMHSNRLPPFTSPRSAAVDWDVLLDSFGTLADHAHREGVVIMIEPLNRYEDHMINRLSDAARLIDEIGSPAFRIVADTYHMNIEESDPIAALTACGDKLAHVQVSDSNRLEPGQGHIDFGSVLAALGQMGYQGDLGLESRLSGDAHTVLPAVPRLLRSYDSSNAFQAPREVAPLTL
jgi:sugar phosphate isomerase/epimerase